MTLAAEPITSAGMLRLYTGPLSMFGMKAEIALREKGLAFERIDVPFENARGYQPKHPVVARVNPKQQVPVLVDGELELFDSTQIFEYLEDIRPLPPLWPAEAKARARARQLELRSDEIYFPNVVRLMGSDVDLSSGPAQQSIAAVDAFCAELESGLSGDYLLGNYSYADIAFFMAQVFAERMGAPLTLAVPRLQRWRMRVGLRPAVQQVMVRLVAYLAATHRTIPPFLADIANASGKPPDTSR